MSKLRIFNNDDTEILPERRPIALLGGKLEQNLDDIEHVLIEQRIGVFQRNGGLVQPGAVTVEVRDGEIIDRVGLIEVSAGSLIEIITTSAQLCRYDARTKKPVPINCPLQVADAYMKRKGRWRLRPLTGIINARTLRPDGSLLDQPGYDRATGLLYIPQPGDEYPAIPERPTRADALAALTVLDELICKYPFVSPEARSVAIAAILTGLIRRMLPTAPGFGFTSPVPGSGKGLLCDTIALLAHGGQPSSLTQGDEEETEKRISSALMRGDLVIAIDNITEPVTGAKLLSVLTQQFADLRPLGSSKLVMHDTRSLFLFNGNNLMIPGDMCRRILMCGIDPECEHPERRAFDFDPLERARQNRGRYVMAGLTILQAYFADRELRKILPCLFEPEEGPADPLGSYVDWSRWVRDPLMWLGQADPAATIDTSKSLDPVAERIADVFHNWAEVIGEGVRITVKDAVDKADTAARGGVSPYLGLTTDPFNTTQSRPGLIDAFNAVAAPYARGAGERVDPLRLGKWLGKHKNRVIDGHRMVLVPEKRDGNAQWCLEKVGNGGKVGSPPPPSEKSH
jgi:putative DNA primase/helicase